MGEARKDVLRLNFDRKLKLEFHGTKVTSDAGLLAFRELDEALGLTGTIESDFCDNRKGRNTQHNIIALLRQSVYGRLAGYEDTNDAERLSVDPAMHQVVGGRAKEHTAASTSLMGRFETEILTQPKNMELLKNLSGQWGDKVRQRKPLKQIILDMDSSVSPTYGNQEGTAYNGYFQWTCYHPLFCRYPSNLLTFPLRRFTLWQRRFALRLSRFALSLSQLEQWLSQFTLRQSRFALWLSEFTLRSGQFTL